MNLLKHNTASQLIPLGFYLDSTDGNTEEIALTINNTDILIWKEGSTTLTSKNVGGATHMQNGVYHITLDATDTNTKGKIKLFTHISGALVVLWEGLVVPVTTYDAIVTNGLNNISPAQVNTECDTALTDYDAPTNTELNARTLPSANYFDNTSDAVIVGTNNDKTGYSISGTKNTLDDMNDIASTDIVSAGAITTLAGAVVNVDLVDTCTTNTDMRGTDGANTTAPDNAGISANSAAIAALNNITANDVWAATTRELTSGNNIVLAKGFGVTGFNDIAASDIVNGTPIDVTLGKIDSVALVDTCTTNTDMRGTDNSLLGTNYTAPDNAGISANSTAISNLNNVSTAQIQTMLDALNDLSGAEIKSELVQALTSDTTTEPTAFPEATAPISEKLSYLFAVAGNKINQTSTTQTIRNRLDNADISSASVSSDGTTTTRGVHS